MKKRQFRNKVLIVFKSKAFTIKSIYRKKLIGAKYNVYLQFNETSERYMFNVDNVDFVKGFKRGTLITLHLGNGGYASLEKGNNVPQDGTVRICII